MDGSNPLQKAVYERFAIEFSKGRTLSQSYAYAKRVRLNPDNEAALKVSGFRISKRAEVCARVEYLQKVESEKRQSEIEAIEVPDHLDADAVLAIFLETTEVLESVYEKLVEKNLPEVRRREYFGVLSSHLSRQGSLVGSMKGEGPVDLPDAPLWQIEWCQCH